MSDSLWGMSLTSFRDATASDAPTPGGGSVAMVSASFGLGLVVMALEISAKKPTPGTESALADLLGQGRALIDRLTAHADNDVTVFQTYMAAFRLPKTTEVEKSARKQALQDALIAATEAPLAAARDTVDALTLAEKAVEQASVRVVSDVGAGAALLGGAVAAVLLNVDINRTSLADTSRAAQYAEARKLLADKGVSLAAHILKRTGVRITEGK